MSEIRKKLSRPLRDMNNLELEIAIHPFQNGKIIVNYPGITGDIDGYNNKYGQMADFMQEKGLGTVIRMGNQYYEELPYPDSMINNFRFLLDYSSRNGEELSGLNNPELYLMGFSAGASTVAGVAIEYPLVKKILLMAPSGDAGKNLVESSLSKFEGEVYIAIGDRDEVVGTGAGKVFYDLATSAKKRELVIIPDCDHQFKGEINGKIMSKAPLWAFAGDETFPSAEGGIKLYSDL